MTFLILGTTVKIATVFKANITQITGMYYEESEVIDTISVAIIEEILIIARVIPLAKP